MSLTERQKIFCKNYITCYNATQSYHAAFPNANYKTCQERGSRLTKDPECKAYIDELRREHFEALHIDAMRIAEKLSEIAFSEKGDDYYNASSQLKALDLLQKQLNLQNQKVELKQETIEVEVK